MAPSEKEIRKTVEELKDDTTADVTDAEAYALLVGASCGDDTALEKWRQLPEQQRARLTADLQPDSKDASDSQG